MSRPSRALQLFDQLSSDLSLSELQELQARIDRLLALKSKAHQQRQAELASYLQSKYPGLGTLLESGRGKLGEPKIAALYSPTGAPPLRAGLTSRALLDQDRADR